MLLTVLLSIGCCFFPRRKIFCTAKSAWFPYGVRFVRTIEISNYCTVYGSQHSRLVAYVFQFYSIKLISLLSTIGIDDQIRTEVKLSPVGLHIVRPEAI